jgi:hypothetical protein
MTVLINSLLKSPLGDLGVKQKINKNKFQMTKTFTDKTKTC